MRVRTSSVIQVLFLSMLSVMSLIACSPNAGGTAEYYKVTEHVSPRDVRHKNYHSYTVGPVFFGAFVQGTDQTTVTGGPPFSVNLGAYSLTEESVAVEILSAEVSVGDRKRFHFAYRFAEQVLDTKVETDDCDGCGHFGSVWFQTNHFLDASPTWDEKVTLRFRVRVGQAEDAEEGEVVFTFLPEVKEIDYFYIPG